MKNFLLFLFCFLLVQTAMAQVPDTVYNYEWQTNAWQPQGRSIYTYNTSCKPTVVVTQAYTNNVWVNASQNLISYTPTGKTSQTIFQVWNTSTNTWGDFARYTYSYNASDLEDSILTEGFLGGQWQNVTLQTNTFNADNTVNVSLTQLWFGNSWLNSSRTTYSYNADKTVHQAVTETWTFINWKNQYRYTYTYDANKNVLTDLYEEFVSNAWKNSILITNTYSSNRLTNSLSQTWNAANSSWVNSSQSNYTYNGDNTVSEVISQDWDTGTGTWINSTRITFHYSNCILPITLLDFSGALKGKDVQLKWSTSSEINSKDFTIQRSSDGINFSNVGTVIAGNTTTQKASYQFTDISAAQLGYSKLYYRLQMNDKDGKQAYSKTLAINIISAGTFTVFPNPVKDMVNIVFNTSMHQCTIRITDQQGKAVQQLQLSNVQQGTSYHVNSAMLKPGVYYLQVISESGIQSMKLLKN